jgi:hypothetical protein
MRVKIELKFLDVVLVFWFYALMTFRSYKTSASVVALAVCLFGPARLVAASFSPHPLWEGEEIFNSQGRLESCAVTRNYAGDDVVSLALGEDGAVLLVLTRLGLQPPPGWRGFITLSVDDGLSHRVPAETVRRSVAMDLTEASALRALLPVGRRLYFMELDDKGYSLEGLDVGLRALADCVAHRRPAEAAVADAPEREPEKPPEGTPETKQIIADLDTYVSEAAAQEDWAMMKKKFADVLAGREAGFPIRTRNKDGRAFTVMRFSGFRDQAEAQAFCLAMQARKRACIVREQ